MAAQVKAIKPMTEGSQQTPPVELIRRKRDGLPLTEVEIKQLIEMYQAGRLLDTQMTAFAMATAIRGMNDDETYFLTKAMQL